MHDPTHLEDQHTRIPEQSSAAPLKTRHVAMIALGGIIGAGLFVGSSAAIVEAGPAVLASFIMTGFLIVVIMRLLGDMLLIHPNLGSFVEYIRLGNGDWAGFTSGWMYWFFWVIVIGSEAIGGAYLAADWVAAPIWVLAVSLVALVKIINLISVRFFGECEFWLSSCKVLAIVAFVVAGILYIANIFGAHSTGTSNLVSHGGFMPKGIASVFYVIPSIIFMMMGSEVATVAAAETSNAKDNIVRVTRSIGIRLTLFYTLSIFVILCLVPWDQITAGHSPFVAAMRVMGIPGAALVMQIVILTAILSCLNSSIYITSRLLPELAERGDAPAYFKQRSTNGVPGRAIAASSILGTLVAFSSIISHNVFAFLISASGGVILLVYFLIATSHFFIRKNASQKQGDRSPFAVRLFPLANVFVVCSIGAVFICMLFDVQLRWTAISSLGSSLCCFLIYLYLRYIRKAGA